ncbi:MAG TPA: adenylate/guanylate cyclase domain-containing protein, partial [Chitinophagaceae bacterium]|nr:adenylate/guanylate cyclase domain-containing protein [Chitinophagaceae bacterium]
MSQSRQLAAIMFTDIVGYTALMGKDEQKAFDLLNKSRQIQKPIIDEFNGVWIKELGDGVMASFKTVSDAVNAAMKIQQTCNANKEFQLRIGIHQGEVVIEENDMFGDAVNIASRLQSIASPGSIFVSEVVHHNVSNKNDINTEFVRTENLKNVKDPVKIYRIKFDGSPPAPHRPLKSIKRKNFAFMFLAVIVTTIVGYFIFQGSKKTNVTATNNEAIDRSIAVLPFENRSNDKDQEYFSDGLSEELINMLTKIPELKVIGRTSSFAFKGKNEDLRTIGQKLDVAHLLEGSVQKDGNKIRVTATLIRASDGKGLWNDSYDRDLSNIFKLQDEIAQTVVQQLRLKLLQFPTTNVAGSGNVDAYNLVLQGNYFYDKLDKENVAKAVDFYSQALAIDSTNARAWGKLANAISRQAWQNYIDQNRGYEKARHAA